MVAPDLEELYTSFSKGLTRFGHIEICLSWYLRHILEEVIHVKNDFVLTFFMVYTNFLSLRKGLLMK